MFCTGLKTMMVRGIPASSQLPSQLEILSCSRCPSMQPLLGLRQLQQLSISVCDTPADELRQLSTLSALTCVDLGYQWGDADTMASNTTAAWPTIAPKVKEMSIFYYKRNAPLATVTTLQQLSCLTAVSRLRLDVNVGPLPATAAEVAGVLLNLQQLQVLEICTENLHTPLFLPTTEAAAAAAAAAAQQAAAAVAAQEAEAAQQAAIAAAANNAPNAAEAAEAAAAAGAAAVVAAMEAMQAIAAAAFVHEAVAAAGDVQAGAGAADGDAGPENGVDGDGDAAAAAGGAKYQLVPLTRTIAQLPQLVSLKLKGAGTTAEAVEHITSMTRLTRLTASGLGFDDAALNSIACSSGCPCQMLK
jgi:hypothetical protein